MASTWTTVRDGAMLLVQGWDGSSLGDRSLGGAEPLGFAAGDENLYRYVGNNPINATDPTGLCADDQIKTPLPKPNTTAAERRFTSTLSKTTKLTDAQLNYLKAMQAALIKAISQAIADNKDLTSFDIAKLKKLAGYLNQMQIGLPVLEDNRAAVLDFETDTVYISITVIKTYKVDLDGDGNKDSVCNPKGVATILIHESVHISNYKHKTDPDPSLTNLAIEVFQILENTPAWQDFLKSQKDNPFPF